MPLLAMIPWALGVLGIGVGAGAIATHAAGEAAEESAKPFGAIWFAGLLGFAGTAFWLWNKFGGKS